MSARHPRTLTEPRVIIGFNLRAQELCESLRSLKSLMVSVDIKQHLKNRAQELCESLKSLKSLMVSVDIKQHLKNRVQELCESRGGRGGRPGLSVQTSLMVSVDVKQY